ncbi:glycosyltransferase family 39 protein [Candidatus Microgenomates bacterium]|nr:glycosyltransferase family 39 protein [Candidatus Microgenomates bacterium]
MRVWRIDNLLGFYYDQGRDALVIWDLWHKGKFFLIGPTTGIEGIFRGPWYYWLIAPFYLLGNGNPVWPSVFLSFTTVVASLLIYILGVMVSGRLTGLVAAIISTFSFQLVYASRWLSNPTPMLLISMLLVLSLFLIIKGKRWGWVITGLMLGFAMQFGSAAEVFYFPAVLVFAIWLASRSGQKKNLPDLKIWILFVIALVIPFLPQIIFDLRHDGILRSGIAKFLIGDGNFKGSFWEVARQRLFFYFDVFNSKLFMSYKNYGFIFGIISLGVLIINRKIFFANQKFVTLLIIFLSPLAGMLFFQGNYGNIYDYYFTGYYLIFILLFSVLLTTIVNTLFGKIILGIFLYLFLQTNVPVIQSYITSGVDGQNTIAFGNQKQAVNWVYEDTGNTPFNVDSYVPPVIPYAYDYLFLWRGTTIYGIVPKEEHVPLLYTLYEVDPPHPERLDAWLARQENIGKVEKEVKFGGITVERRHRLPSNPVTQ